MADLRATKRALVDDLGLDADDLADPIEELRHRHQVIEAFVTRRSQNPIGNETTNLPVSSQTVYNLHSGRYRALTWHDEDEDVVWLLGAGWHEQGSADDAYAVLKRLDEDDVLLPTHEDYLLLYQQREASGVSNFKELLTAVSEEGPQLAAAADADPGYPKDAVIGDLFRVVVTVDKVEDEPDYLWVTYTVRFEMPPARAGILPSSSDWAGLLVPAFLPDTAEVANIEWRITEDAWTAVYEDVETFPAGE